MTGIVLGLLGPRGGHRDSLPDYEVRGVIYLNGLSHALRFENWLDFYGRNDLSKALDSFFNILHTHMENSRHTKRFGRKNKLIRPWMDMNLIRLINTENKLPRLFAILGSDSQLKQRRNNLNKLKRSEVVKLRNS